jgi:hypothetical protein
MAMSDLDIARSHLLSCQRDLATVRGAHFDDNIVNRKECIKMNFDQAVAILLQYDTYPRSLLDDNQRAALKCADDVLRDHAYRAVSEFLSHEISKKYISKTHQSIPDKLAVLNEVHDYGHI